MDRVSPRRFETLGFAPAYACELDPEFPGTGDWGCPQYTFHRDGPTTGPFRSRGGAPLFVRVDVEPAGRWVGAFESGGDWYDLTSVFACPHPTQALVVCGGQPYLVEVAAPAQSTALDLAWVVQVERVHGLDLLVLVTDTSMAAISPAGQQWQSEQLCASHLRVLAATEHGIRCCAVAYSVYDWEEFVVDPRTGQRRPGPPHPDA